MVGSGPTHDFVACWGVHSSLDDQPVMRAWARTEAEARAELEALKARDAEAARTEYWVVQMTRSELAQWKSLGIVPAEVEP